MPFSQRTPTNVFAAHSEEHVDRGWPSKPRRTSWRPRQLTNELIEQHRVQTMIGQEVTCALQGVVYVLDVRETREREEGETPARAEPQCQSALRAGSGRASGTHPALHGGPTKLEERQKSTCGFWGCYARLLSKLSKTSTKSFRTASGTKRQRLIREIGRE